LLEITDDWSTLWSTENACGEISIVEYIDADVVDRDVTEIVSSITMTDSNTISMLLFAETPTASLSYIYVFDFKT
jgi:hypothetical protein